MTECRGFIVLSGHFFPCNKEAGHDGKCRSSLDRVREHLATGMSELCSRCRTATTEGK